MQSGALDVAATAAPGIKDILVLGKVKQLERAEDHADLIVLDAPAAGHAITFLLAPAGSLDAVRVGPINAQANDVLELLTDPARCQVVLVTLPEETPVNELVDTAYHLEDRVGVSLGPVVVNGLYPEIAGPRRRPGVGGRGGRHDPAQGRGGGAGRRPPRSAGSAWRCSAEQVARLEEQLPLAAAAPALPVHDRARHRRDRRAGRRSLLDGIDALPGGRRADGGDRGARTSPLLAVLDEARDHRLRRLGRRGQDHHRRGPRARGGPPRPPSRASSPSTRPSAWPTRSGLEGLTNSPSTDRRRLAGRAVGDDARHEAHLRRPGRASTPRAPTRPSASSATASTGTSPARSRARRSTWRWRSSTSCTSERDFDLVVVDTPPTRHALDFLDAPRRLTRFLDHRFYRSPDGADPRRS